MFAKFELSAYGVEEMNKQEMIEVDGGSLFAWGVIGLIVLIVGGEAISYYLSGDNSMIYIPDGGNIVQTGEREFTVVAPPGYRFCGQQELLFQSKIN